MQALGQGFSSGISRAVARELGLTPAPGQSLSSRTVRQAIDMAETAQQAMSGVDFFTALSCSAAKNGPAFQRACQDLGVTASSLDMQAREQIDRSMERRFQSATQAGQSPVSMAAAEAWLRQELESLR
ncbi:hypothetical protein SDC9_174381 [bioreactor metagenome]|uniref:Uncharacterized protein n=1 Tax=bioreactor metagenome TaxID=1076179 RepID=A0A645GJR0_9ZZZZ